MGVTNLADVSNQAQQIWSPLLMDELRATMVLGSLVNREYEGDIKKLNDRVYVSQVNAPAGQLLGSTDNSFSSETLSTSRITVTADKRAVAAYEIQDLVELQTQLGAADSPIRQALVYSVNNQINTYLNSLVSPSTSNPDHLINSVTDFNAAQLASCRILAGQAKWGKDKPWYGLLDPSYYGDIMNASTLTSADYVNDMPVVGGNVVSKRFGFNLIEDNSKSVDTALLFHPDFMVLCMQKEPTIQVSSLHSNKQFGYVISCDVIFGAALGIDGAKKHIKVLAA